jgi:hypothetical protein
LPEGRWRFLPVRPRQIDRLPGPGAFGLASWPGRQAEIKQVVPMAEHRLNSVGNLPLSNCCRNPAQSWAEDGAGSMPYIVFFGMRDEAEISSAGATTANEALAIVETLQKREQEVRFISSPHEGEFGIEMLRVLAKEEQAELPMAPVA